LIINDGAQEFVELCKYNIINCEIIKQIASRRSILREWSIMDVKKRVCDALKSLREHGVTYTHISKNIGVAEGTVRNWAAGKTEPSASELQKIANLCQKNIAWFYGDLTQADAFAPANPSTQPDILTVEGKIIASELFNIMKSIHQDSVEKTATIKDSTTIIKDNMTMMKSIQQDSAEKTATIKILADTNAKLGSCLEKRG